MLVSMNPMHQPPRRRTATRVPLMVALPLLAAACADAGAPPRFEVAETTIADVQQAIRSGRATCRDVVESHLARIEAYEERLNAITVLNPSALRQADEIDAALALGTELGPLFCVPMLVKDNFDTADMVTTGGSIALASSVPPDDAFMVRMIRHADAIVIAKTNMAEWAFSPRQTISSSFDTTRNAYDLDRVPAGSSGGTASGVAASLGLIGLGTDTGNSIRGPSSHLSLVGIRSTIGLSSRDGVIPLSFDRDIAGPMGRTVEDVAKVFNVVAGVDPSDPYTLAGADRREEDYAAFLDHAGLEGARIGVLRSLVDREEADPAILALFEAAIGDVAALGAQIVDPFMFDVDANNSRDGMFCPRFRYDMWVYLQSLDDPPITDVIEVLGTGQYSDHAEAGLRRFSGAPLDVHPSRWSDPCPDYAENPGRQAYLSELVGAMDDAGVDALIYPSWLCVPAPLDRGRREYCGDNSQRVAPATGMPAITVPMGFTNGVWPAGLQILARPWAEGLLFKYAYAYEQATRHRRPPTGFPPLP